MRVRAGLIQLLGLDQGEGHISIQDGIMGQVDLLLAAFSQELLDLVAAVGKGGGLGTEAGGVADGGGWLSAGAFSTKE